MRCPCCNKELRLSTNTELNIDSYVKSCCSITECCGQMIYIVPRVTYSANPAPQRKQDDWGRIRRDKN